jgi:hypothetical protein
MKATTEDGVFTFEIERSKDKYVGTVQNHNSGAYDTTGKTSPGHEWRFDSLQDAQAWAKSHLNELGVPGKLHWEK